MELYEDLEKIYFVRAVDRIRQEVNEILATLFTGPGTRRKTWGTGCVATASCGADRGQSEGCSGALAGRGASGLRSELLTQLMS